MIGRYRIFSEFPGFDHRVRYDNITTSGQLAEFCDSVANAAQISFDTEFVSERTYRPQLCLIQLAVGDRLAVVDPLSIDDLTPLWELLASADNETIVHAGREELCFLMRALKRQPRRFFDIQIAAGMTGLEYPAAYSTLVSKLLNRSLGKGETRTDWSRRPLSERQIDYALQDVIYLVELRSRLGERLEALGRTEWLDDELAAWQDRVEAAEFKEGWRRISGLTKLSRKSLAVARELWRWRNQEAKRRNRPPRHILRDDLLVELARRGSDDVARIKAVRGLDRSNKKSYLEAIAKCIAEANVMPESQWPRQEAKTSNHSQLNLLGQFLTAALSSICRTKEIAPSLVGTAQDVRDLIAFRLNLNDAADNGPPALASGWREEVVGHTIEELLDGKLSIVIDDPLSEHPLNFESRKRP